MMSRSSFTIARSVAAVVAACALAGCGSSENAQIVGVPPGASASASAPSGSTPVTGFQQAQSQQLNQALGTVGVPAHVKHTHTPAPHLKLPH